MEIEIGKRQTGRTTNLIKKTIKNEDACLVVIHQNEKKRVQNLEPKIKDRVFTFQEVQDIRFSASKFKEVYIDNADWILQSLIRKEITLMSLEK